jgi:hypothetical protein
MRLAHHFPQGPQRAGPFRHELEAVAFVKSSRFFAMTDLFRRIGQFGVEAVPFAYFSLGTWVDLR